MSDDGQCEQAQSNVADMCRAAVTDVLDVTSLGDKFERVIEFASRGETSVPDEVIPFDTTCKRKHTDYNFKDRYDNLKKNYETTLKSLKTNYQSLNNIMPIYNTKIQELDKITRKIKIYEQNSLIDNRKTSAADENIELYNKIYYYILFFYFLALIIILIIVKFFQKELYKNKKVIIILILYIVLPFILRYLIDYVFYIYNDFLEKNNLRDDIISYTDIVKDYDTPIPQYHEVETSQLLSTSQS